LLIYSLQGFKPKDKYTIYLWKKIKQLPKNNQPANSLFSPYRQGEKRSWVLKIEVGTFDDEIRDF
jgi:hypothetical protein